MILGLLLAGLITSLSVSMDLHSTVSSWTEKSPTPTLALSRYQFCFIRQHGLWFACRTASGSSTFSSFVSQIFDRWKEVLPYFNPGFNETSLPDAAYQFKNGEKNLVSCFLLLRIPR
jgi:hypothetical protein